MLKRIGRRIPPRVALFCSTVLLTTLPLSVAAAQDASGGPIRTGTVEEVIVTAERRQASVQDTALAVSAFSGNVLKERAVSDVQSLVQLAPNTEMGQSIGAARISIRGIGTENISVGNEGRIAVHIDGVYASRPSAALANIYDLERIEVVRGPQGTLYGRNATGGAINIITAAPRFTPDGYISAATGNYDWRMFEGAYGGPLSENVAVRASFQTADRSGFGRNVISGSEVDDQHTRSARLSSLFKFNEATSLRLTYDYFVEKDRAFGFHYGGVVNPAIPPMGLVRGGFAAAKPRDIAEGWDPVNKRTFSGYAAELTTDLGSIRLTSITAYRISKFYLRTTTDVTSPDLIIYSQYEDAETFTQEFRASGEYARGDWVIGGFYLNEDLKVDTTIRYEGTIFGSTPGLKQGTAGLGDKPTEAYAGYGQARYHLTDQLTLSVGARYSWEKRGIDEGSQRDFVNPWPPTLPYNPILFFESSKAWKSFTPRVAVEYRPREDWLAYASIAQGFKSGGYNLNSRQPAYNPEHITSYEAGVKIDTFSRRVRANIAAFYYDYQDLQTNKTIGPITVFENAAKARVTGGEVEITALPTDVFRVDFSVGLLNAEFTRYTTADPAFAALGVQDLKGNKLPQAPTYTVNLAGEYTIPLSAGDLVLRAEGRWKGRVYFTSFNIPVLGEDPSAIYNAFVTYRSGNGNWTAAAFVKNLTDELVKNVGFVPGTIVGTPADVAYEPPRTFGIQITRAF